MYITAMLRMPRHDVPHSCCNCNYKGKSPPCVSPSRRSARAACGRRLLHRLQVTRRRGTFPPVHSQGALLSNSCGRLLTPNHLRDYDSLTILNHTQLLLDKDGPFPAAWEIRHDLSWNTRPVDLGRCPAHLLCPGSRGARGAQEGVLQLILYIMSMWATPSVEATHQTGDGFTLLNIFSIR